MKEHPADAWERQQLARAVSYTVHFRKGPFERYDERADTLAEARAIEARLNAAHGQYGRRAIVYGVLPDGSALPLGERYQTQAMRAAAIKTSR